MFLGKSEEFLRSAQSNYSRKEWNASVSSAVHSGILACDVLTTAILSLRNTGAHDEVIPLVKKAIANDPTKPKDFEKRIQQLLQVKSLAEYEDRSVGETEAKACLTHAERILTWVRIRSRTFE